MNASLLNKTCSNLRQALTYSQPKGAVFECEEDKRVGSGWIMEGLTAEGVSHYPPDGGFGVCKAEIRK